MKQPQDPVVELVEEFKLSLVRLSQYEDEITAGVISEEIGVAQRNVQSDIAFAVSQQLKSRGAIHLLLPLLNDENPMVRLWAA